MSTVAWNISQNPVNFLQMYVQLSEALDIYRFSSVPRLPPAHASIWFWIDKNSFVSRNKYVVADYDDSQFIIDLQGLLHYVASFYVLLLRS